MGASKNFKEFIISKEEILAIIEKAKFTPSGDNCQPWIFKVRKNQLDIYYDKSRGEHALNINMNATFLTLGTLLESIKIASSEFQLNSDFEIFSFDLVKKSESLVKVATTYWSQNNSQADPLLPYITTRFTDRRAFKTDPIPQALIEEIQRLGSDLPNCSINVTKSNNSRLMDYIVKSDEYMWLHKEIIIDLFRWIRLSDNEVRNTTDGMPWRNVNFKYIELPFFKWIRSNPLRLLKLWKFGLKSNVNKMAIKAVKNSAGIILVSVNSKEKSAIVNAGRVAYRMWVTLNSKGYGVQPISLSTIPVYDLATNNFAEFMKPEFQEHFKNGKSLLQDEFKLSSDHIPLWMFRTGLAEPLPMNSRTKRRSTEEILQFDFDNHQN